MVSETPFPNDTSRPSTRHNSTLAPVSKTSPDAEGAAPVDHGGVSRDDQVVGDNGTNQPDEQHADWQFARRMYNSDKIIEARASGCNKGGLLLRWKGLPGFVPASQLVNFPKFHVEEERQQHLRERQNQVLRVKIIEIDEASNRLIFSERAARVSAVERQQLLEDISVGQQRRGVITTLADFGAFVDLGGVEGLIHISQLSWRRLSHPSDVVQPFQPVEVLVLEVDEEKERVALSRKLLLRDPWPNVEERYEPGQIVEGIISNIATFGAFTLVEEELEGLIHVTELSDGDCAHPSEVVEKGQKVRARVLSVSGEERRLSLSMRTPD